MIERRIEGAHTARRAYARACAAGFLGLVVLAVAPEELSASAAILLVSGLATPLTRTLSTIWVNRETSSDVRATVHLFLAQAEYLGEILLGALIAVVAAFACLSPAIVAGAALLGMAAVLVQTHRSVRVRIVPD